MEMFRETGWRSVLAQLLPGVKHAYTHGGYAENSLLVWNTKRNCLPNCSSIHNKLCIHAHRCRHSKHPRPSLKGASWGMDEKHCYETLLLQLDYIILFTKKQCAFCLTEVFLAHSCSSNQNSFITSLRSFEKSNHVAFRAQSRTLQL